MINGISQRMSGVFSISGNTLFKTQDEDH
jgi:hypothetical protein